MPDESLAEASAEPVVPAPAEAPAPSTVLSVELDVIVPDHDLEVVWADG